MLSVVLLPAVVCAFRPTAQRPSAALGLSALSATKDSGPPRPEQPSDGDDLGPILPDSLPINFRSDNGTRDSEFDIDEADSGDGALVKAGDEDTNEYYRMAL